MDKALFDELLQSVQEMDDIVHGKCQPSRAFHFEPPNVKAIREKTALSQNHFAALIGVSKRTLENWEQGRRKPTGPAQALLRIVNQDPKHAVKALYVV